ncbi:mitochondrial small ribosomal subunit Rsm22-domain-containing protein [Zychaea mexicana]|uniref:mitochondrial small ribosomal subunit Rsm22-domain-containing protein n=1 Tax=Zychaea mexicana TaxID=64656 RepID=UPI0022FDDB9A|nr:mitochondrial small ribosomal subunit Rsm22-domain-containing protein [Zychaea mexicana]KAI9496757.1 mitochondrial small ribosomal subunit Rsm22-domain-containing protein [Zychaea mexicana]
MFSLSKHCLRRSGQWIRSYSTEKAVFLDQKQLEALEELQSIAMTEIPVPSSVAEPVVRSSPEAAFGRKRIGAVSLPRPLIQGIAELIEENDKRLIRTDALRLYESLRSTSRIPTHLPDYDNGSSSSSSSSHGKSKKRQAAYQEPHTLAYGPRESIAYAAGVLPSTYAATMNVLAEISHRIADFAPKSILDFGTGPGTALWAAQEVFSDLQSYVGVDLSEDMLNIAERLQANLSPYANMEFKRYLGAVVPNAPKPDLVVSAFTIGDLPSQALQRSIVDQLWEHAGDILVLVDRGTPIGFSNIARARQWILDQHKDDVHVVAPCPHDRPCPLLYSPDARPDAFWCHFSQRVQRPPFLMKTKHSKFNLEDSKYAYVVLRRGSRSKAESSHDDLPEAAYTWPRLIQPPLKKHGHVVMDVCAKEGEIQRMVIPKSQGKIPYRDARKAAWGDLFPHPSKNKVVTRVSKGVSDNDRVVNSDGVVKVE